MKQMPFLLKLKRGAFSPEELSERMEALRSAIAPMGASGFSVWQAEDMLFGYYELWEGAGLPDDTGSEARRHLEALGENAVLIASPGNMRLVFGLIHDPRKEKTDMVYRVFLTRIKPGCAEEYKRRHDELRKGMGELNGTQNFTCWQAGDYICGYKETPRGELSREDDPANGSNAAWEHYMLKIMDWLTDDADCFSGEHHEPVRLILKS